MQEVIDMPSTTTVTTTKVETENVDNLTNEVGLNISDSNGSSRGSVESTPSTDSNNSSNRSTPTPVSNVSLGDSTSINETTTPVNDKPKDEEEEEEDDKDTESTTTTAIPGGQLKFFKDGMLCLQLAHLNSGKNSKWIQIRTKTIIPSLVHVSKEVSIPCQLSPANSFSGIGTRVESSTSRSVSDDGCSSVLSSPILRESWKQQVPKKISSNISLQFYMSPGACIIKRRKILFQKFPRLTRQPYNLSWMKKLLSCTTTTTKENSSNENGPSECLECEDGELKSTIRRQRKICVRTEEEGEEAVPLVEQQNETVSNKKKLQNCINRLSERVDNVSSQVNSDCELNISITSNNKNHNSGGEVQHIDGSKTSVKNVRVSSLPVNCDVKSTSSSIAIRPKITEKRSKIADKDKTTILSVPLTTSNKLIHRLKTDHNMPIDFSKITESSSSSSSSPSITHSDRREIKGGGGGKSKKLRKEKLKDQRQKVSVSSPYKSHINSSNYNSDKKSSQSESMALNLSSTGSSNRQSFTSPDVTPFNISLPFANQLYPINYLSVLAASSSPSTLNPAASFPSYSNTSSVGLNFQQQLLQQQAMSSVISNTVNCLLANNNSSSGSSSDRTRRDPKDNKGHSLNVVQDGNRVSKKMQHKSKTKKSSNANFKIPEFNANPHSFSSSKVKSDASKLLYFGNSNNNSSSSSSAQRLLETTSSSTSPLSRNNTTFLRNLLDTSYPIPSNKTEGRDILKSNASKSHHHLSSKTKSNAGGGGGTGNLRAKSHQNMNTKLTPNVINHGVSFPLAQAKSSSSSKSLSKLSSKLLSSDRDQGTEKSSLNTSTAATNFLSQLSSQRSSSDLSQHHAMDILRGSTSNNAVAAAAFHNSLLSSGGILPGFPAGAAMAEALAAANYFQNKNPSKTDFNSLLSGNSLFDYTNALSASQKIPWSSFLPFQTNQIFDTLGREGLPFGLHPTSLASSTASSSSESSKYNDTGSDAPLNLCKKSRPN